MIEIIVQDKKINELNITIKRTLKDDTVFLLKKTYLNSNIECPKFPHKNKFFSKETLIHSIVSLPEWPYVIAGVVSCHCRTGLMSLPDLIRQSLNINNTNK